MFKVNFHKKPDEIILYVSDYPEEHMLSKISREQFDKIKERNDYTKKLYDLTKKLYGDDLVKLSEYPSVLQSGLDAPDYISEALKKCDIFLIPTSYSLTHTKTRMDATEAGVRGVTLPGFEPYMFDKNGSMTADYEKIAQEIDKGINFISNTNPGKGKLVHITSDSGSDLTFKIMEGDRKLKGDNGLCREKSSFSNLPAGEIYTAPIEETTNGTMVIEKGWSSQALEEEDMIFKFEDGYLASLTGAKEDLLKIVGLNPNKKSEEDSELFNTRRNVAELGIGMNPKATHYESLLEGEKIMGTCHIAIGTNKFFGGNIVSDIHFDYIIDKPTIKIEENTFMKNGKHLF